MKLWNANALSPEERGGCERWGLTEQEYREGVAELAAEQEATRLEMIAEHDREDAEAQ